MRLPPQRIDALLYILFYVAAGYQDCYQRTCRRGFIHDWKLKNLKVRCSMRGCRLMRENATGSAFV